MMTGLTGPLKLKIKLPVKSNSSTVPSSTSLQQESAPSPQVRKRKYRDDPTSLDDSAKEIEKNISLNTILNSKQDSRSSLFPHAQPSIKLPSPHDKFKDPSSFTFNSGHTSKISAHVGNFHSNQQLPRGNANSTENISQSAKRLLTVVRTGPRLKDIAPFSANAVSSKGQLSEKFTELPSPATQKQSQKDLLNQRLVQKQEKELQKLLKQKEKQEKAIEKAKYKEEKEKLRLSGQKVKSVLKESTSTKFSLSSPQSKKLFPSTATEDASDHEFMFPRSADVNLDATNVSLFETTFKYPQSTQENSRSLFESKHSEGGSLGLSGAEKSAGSKGKVRKLLDESPADSSELLKIVDKIQKKDVECIFKDPVTEAVAPDYFSIISRPMDFSTMRQKLANGAYNSWESLEADLELMFTNAMTYNPPDTVYFKHAAMLLDVSKKLIELGKQGVTNFRGRTAGIVRAHNSKLAQEAAVERETLKQTRRVDQLAAKHARKSGDMQLRFEIGRGASAGGGDDDMGASEDVEVPKIVPQPIASGRRGGPWRPVYKEYDGRKPLAFGGVDTRGTYRPRATGVIASLGGLANFVSSEGLPLSSGRPVLRELTAANTSIPFDAYALSLASFLSFSSSSIQAMYMEQLADCVPVEPKKSKKPTVTPPTSTPGFPALTPPSAPKTQLATPPSTQNPVGIRDISAAGMATLPPSNSLLPSPKTQVSDTHARSEQMPTSHSSLRPMTSPSLESSLHQQQQQQQQLLLQQQQQQLQQQANRTSAIPQQQQQPQQLMYPFQQQYHQQSTTTFPSHLANAQMMIHQQHQQLLSQQRRPSQGISFVSPASSQPGLHNMHINGTVLDDRLRAAGPPAGFPGSYGRTASAPSSLQLEIMPLTPPNSDKHTKAESQSVGMMSRPLTLQSHGPVNLPPGHKS